MKKEIERSLRERERGIVICLCLLGYHVINKKVDLAHTTFSICFTMIVLPKWQLYVLNFNLVKEGGSTSLRFTTTLVIVM